jgi:hypothetical protein
MSIWCSTVAVGFDRCMTWPKRPTGGTVRKYADGWSNHYPDSEVEGPAVIDLATIPAWCVPGHEEDFSYRKVGPWLRMGVFGEGVNHWTKKTEYADATVVLNESAVRALRDHLDEWLTQPKARPRRSAA